MLANHLAWKKKFLVNSALTVRKACQHAPYVQHTLPGFLCLWKGWAFPRRGLLFVIWVIRGNPGSSLVMILEEYLVISDCIQLLAYKHTLLLLFINAQLRHKLHGDPRVQLKSSTPPPFWPHSQNPATGPMLSHINPVHILTPSFFNVYFNIFFAYLAMKSLPFRFPN
jgi:hypothetical protein